MTMIELKSKLGVTTYINTLQGIINRLANNSAQCKTWCITIIAALLALKGKKEEFGVGVFYAVIGLFFFLDCFYLGQERRMRKIMRDFVEKLNGLKTEEVAKSIYNIKYENVSSEDCKSPEALKHFWQQTKSTLYAVVSFSTLPFYGIFALIIKMLFSTGLFKLS